MKVPKIQVAVWPKNIGTQYWGAADYSNPAYDTCTSTWLSLRAVRPKDGWLADLDRSVSDIGVYVWIAKDGCINLQLKVHEMRSADIADLERMVKLMRLLERRMKKYTNYSNFVHNSNLLVELTAFFKALGVEDQCVAYNGSGMPDTTVPLAELIRRVSEKMHSIKLKEAA